VIVAILPVPAGRYTQPHSRDDQDVAGMSMPEFRSSTFNQGNLDEAAQEASRCQDLEVRQDARNRRFVGGLTGGVRIHRPGDLASGYEAR
jgi:hypothetical protein